MKPTRLGRAASAAMGAVAGLFGGADAVQAEKPEAASGTPPPREHAQDAPQPPATPAKPPPARKPAAPPGVRPIPSQPARVRAVRAKRADERRDGSDEQR